MVKAKWPAMPVILTSDYKLVNHFPDNGNVVYCQKPWSIDTFVEVAWQLLKGQPQ